MVINLIQMVIRNYKVKEVASKVYLSSGELII